MKKCGGFILVAVNCFLMSIGSAFAGPGSGTAFTYQGRLNSSAGPATGSYDLTFALFTDSSATTQVGGTLTNTTVAVSNGLFTVNLDFGDGIFGADPLWLQIGVRTNGETAFTLLSPLQQLTATPNAIYSLNAASASSLTGTLQSTQLNGTIPIAKLPSSVVTNGATNVVLKGSFSGDGSGLANVNSVINNTTANPVPVAVQGPVGISGTVGIAGRITAELATVPLPVYSADNPARQACSFSASAFLRYTNAVFNVPLTMVPSDRILVIECLSAFVDGAPYPPPQLPSFYPPPPTNQYQVILQTYSTTPILTNQDPYFVLYTTNDAPYYGFALPSTTGLALPSLTQTMKAYASPGTVVFMNCLSSASITNGSYTPMFHVSITGHYVYVTPPITTNAPPPSQQTTTPPDSGGGSTPPSN